jgi:glutathione peroxidase
MKLQWLTDLIRRSRRRGRLPARHPAMLGLIVFVLGIVFVGRFLVPLSSSGLNGSVLSPVALLPDAASDDGAGDALTPQAEAEIYLPVPAIFEDERVVAAAGPLARLACYKNDPPSAQDPARAVQDQALASPLAGAGSDAEAIASEHLLAAAASPLVGVAPDAETDSAASIGPAAMQLADSGGAAAPAGSCPALLQRTFNRLQTGKPESLCQFDGKVLLVVNTASYCGYTHQFEGLEAMYRKYKDRGLVVVGFPSNDFGKQEPGTNAEIAEFCRLTYGVEFPMFEKSSVTNLAGNPLFTDLAARTGKAPQWNFHKYVIDRNGQPVASFTSQVEPNDRNLVSLVERLLAERPRKS